MAKFWENKGIPTKNPSFNESVILNSSNNYNVERFGNFLNPFMEKD